MSEQPIRVQRKRTKGWRMPPNTVYVGRPTIWGNPYPDVETFRFTLSGKGPLADVSWLMTKMQLHKKGVIELRGKNLACWCPLDKPCHADVLLEMANE